MSVLDLFRAPRIVQARLVSGAVAIAGGRTAVALEIEGAGVLTVGDVRHRFWRGFSGTVLVRVSDPVSGPLHVRVRSLVGRAERAIPFVPLPALPAAPRARAPALPPPPRPPRVTLRSLAISVFPRGRQ